MAARFGWRKTPNLTRGLGIICTLNMYIQSVYVYIIYIYLKVYTKSERHKQMYMYVCIDDIEISKAER